jgi:hypothetical protein
MLKLLPVIISALLLAAHFLRADQLLLVVVSLAFPLLLLPRNKWATRVVQLILFLGALEWVGTLMGIIDERQVTGESWTAAAIILGSVALFTAASALPIYSIGADGRRGN